MFNNRKYKKIKETSGFYTHYNLQIGDTLISMQFPLNMDEYVFIYLGSIKKNIAL